MKPSSPTRVAEIKPAPYNPRMISDEDLQALKNAMQEFGDLSGLVVNVRSGHMVGGHQRTKHLDPSWPIIKRPVHDKVGTVAAGYIRTPFGRFTYREVNWNRKKELAANLTANKISGEWDISKLAPVLEELKASPEELQLTGFDEIEIDNFIQEADRIILAERTDLHGHEKPELSIVPYLGGKQGICSEIISRIPEHTVYVEVFGGAASVLLNKPPSKGETYNDIDHEMVNMLMQIRDHPVATMRAASTIPYSRELFERWRQEFRDNKGPKDPVERGARFFYIMCSCWAGGFEKGWAFEVSRGGSKRLRYNNHMAMMPKVSERLRDVVFDCVDFERCIENWDSPDTFFFLDPPYYGIPEDYYRNTMTEEQHIQLAELLSKVKGKWLLTYAHHTKVRELYKDFETQLVSRTGSVADSADFNGKRPGKVHNVIITNYPQSAKKS